MAALHLNCSDPCSLELLCNNSSLLNEGLYCVVAGYQMCPLRLVEFIVSWEDQKASREKESSGQHTPWQTLEDYYWAMAETLAKGTVA